jgi:hypothetical protein
VLRVFAEWLCLGELNVEGVYGGSSSETNSAELCGLAVNDQNLVLTVV